MKIRIKDIHNLDVATYIRFFHISKASTPFHALDFLQALKKSRKDLKLCFLSIEENGRIVAVMPYFSRHFFPSKKKSLIYGCYGGFIYEDKDECVVYEFVKKNIRKYKPIIQAYHNDNIYATSPLVPTPQTTWIVDTDMSYNELFTRLHYKTRNQVKKSENIGAVVKDMESEEELAQVKEIYKQLILKHSISKPFKEVLFHELFMAGKKGGNVFFKIAKLENKVIAFSIFLYNTTEVFYWINASDKNFLSYNGTNSILHNILVYCTQNINIKSLNMGAVPEGNDTLLHFKKRWGAESKVYYQYSYK